MRLIDADKMKEDLLTVDPRYEAMIQWCIAVLDAQPTIEEQQCWFPPKYDDAAKRLNDLIFDINPAEICSQIESDNLKRWCGIIQATMRMAMFQLPCWNEKEEV